MRRVVCAALQAHSGRLILGPRHWDMTMRDQLNALPEGIRQQFGYGQAVQGFIDQYGEFMDREEAWNVALRAGQLITWVGGNDQGKLFSENLY